MKHGSLLGISLELIEILRQPGPFPADARIGRFFRDRRFLGSRDRRFVSAAAYAWLRHFPRARARWAAWAGESLSQLEGRLAALGDALALARDGLFPWDVETTLAAAGDARWTSDEERDRAAAIVAGLGAPPTGEAGWPSDPDERRAARMSLPRWLADALTAERGEAEATRLAEALCREATVDLRVNQRRVDREKALRRLKRELEVEAVELTPFSPVGLRLRERRNLTATTCSRKGWLEVADEGSQIVGLALDAAPGMKIVDACCGAGGKTLALADILLGSKHDDDALGTWSQTRFWAFDIDEGRLAELDRRMREADAESWIDARKITPEGPLPADLPPADLVLVDAPCTGFGTLRRNPDLKLRYGPEDVESFAEIQRAILERFAPAVAPGGRLAYSTCSLLRAENEAVAEAFSAAHPEFEPYGSSWAAKRLPAACFSGEFVKLDPVRTETDGFFLAQWRRR